MVATYAWLCGGEFPSQRLRSYTFGLAASVGFLGAWLGTFTAPYFINPSALDWGKSSDTTSKYLELTLTKQALNTVTFGVRAVLSELYGPGSTYQKSRYA